MGPMPGAKGHPTHRQPTRCAHAGVSDPPCDGGYGPENTSRLRRFAVRLLNSHAKPNESIASMTRKLAAKTRLVFDYLLMTKNSTRHAAAA